MSAMSRGSATLIGGIASNSTRDSGRSRSSSPRPGTEGGIGHQDEAPLTRQALVRYAVDGLQRFKQSWKSVMLLKAGIGLGQVIVLIVLLILANFIPSPLYPSQTQVAPSDACPHPHLFQAWMGVQIARLTVCWSVSCWMCIRTEKARERRRAARAREEADAETDDCDGASGQAERAPAVVLSAVPSHPARASRQSLNPHTQAAPSLVHSSSSTSTVTLATMAMSASASSPSTPHTSHFASSSRLDLSCVPEVESACTPVKEEHEMALKRSRGRTGQNPLGSEQEANHLEPPRPRLAERPSMRSLREARSMHRGEATTTREAVDVPIRGVAGWLDKHALSISRSLGIISLILFLLGNILLFYPPPGGRSCYSANPLLWWGVCAVTAVGWVLLLQVFFVVVIVGLGGTVVLNALRRLGVIPAPPEPEPPRAAQPDPLTPEELASVKIVCYVPAEARPDLASEKPSAQFCATRLPFPPVYLPAHQSSCAICQDSFAPPVEGRTVLLKADRLRQLRCDHVYHMDCIDQWLLRGSGNCPACNAPAREESPESNSQRRSQSRRRSLLSRGQRVSRPAVEVV